MTRQICVIILLENELKKMILPLGLVLVTCRAQVTRSRVAWTPAWFPETVTRSVPGGWHDCLIYIYWEYPKYIESWVCCIALWDHVTGGNYYYFSKQLTIFAQSQQWANLPCRYGCARRLWKSLEVSVTQARPADARISPAESALCYFCLDLHN